MPETTIELSIIDDFSGKSKTIQNSARALCKSFDELLERQKKAVGKKAHAERGHDTGTQGAGEGGARL